MNRKPLLITAGVILSIGFIITTYFLIDANRDLRGDIRAMKAENEDLRYHNRWLSSQSDSLKKAVADRDRMIKISTMAFDSLRTTLEDLNDRNIVTVYENYHTVTALDLDGQINLLSRFIAEADSAGR